MGRRIRQIRLGAGLRQWELARILGTTQSAVHKYEHGVVPEPRRLIELARVGETSVEWVLTGEHWENGATDRARLSTEILDTARCLCTLDERSRQTMDEALRIVREAVSVLEGRDSDPVTQLSPHSAALKAHAGETLELLERAWKIQRAVLERVTRDAKKRLAQG
ncbi:MAG: helix-turn-helix domain-containing protein [Acidobacteria bacterium]|nr:helix-turn-helix domain-containing protein [Acidobacteriota bacterium]